MSARDVMEEGRISSGATVARGLAALAGEYERLVAENEELRKNNAWMANMGWNTAAEEMDRLREDRNRMLDVCVAVEMALGDDGGRRYTVDELADELRRRLMPEGYEWPKFEGDEPVMVGDLYVDSIGVAHVVKGICFYGYRGFLQAGDGSEHWFDPGELMRRPSNEGANEDDVPNPSSDVPDDGDSWEQWFEDYDIPSSVDYCDKRGIHLNSVAFCFSARDNDLKRRAMKLAGVGA